MDYRDARVTLHEWLSGFGLPVWDEYGVPQGEPLPYVVYTPSYSDFQEQDTLAVRVYGNAEEVTTCVDAILAELPATIRTQGGGIAVYAGSPLVQDLDGGSEGVLARYVNLTIEYS